MRFHHEMIKLRQNAAVNEFGRKAQLPLVLLRTGLPMWEPFTQPCARLG